MSEASESADGETRAPSSGLIASAAFDLLRLPFRHVGGVPVPDSNRRRAD